MDFNEMLDAIEIVLRRNPHQGINILGAPGGGKTSLCFAVAERLGIPPDRIWVNHAPLADPVDYRGVPWTDEDGVTRWHPPARLWEFRKGTGKGMIIHDDMAQAPVAVKNVLGNLLLARHIDDVHLDEEVVQLCTGNQQEHRSGTTRNPAHLDNRLMHLELETSLDAWCSWAMREGLDPLLIAFIRLRPAFLHDSFDPDKRANPTPRTWEMVGRSLDPSAMPRGSYLSACRGLVGEGAAAEWVGARDIMSSMPSVDGILRDPATAPVPQGDSAVLYAVSTALAARASASLMPNILTYIDRLPREFAILTMKAAITRDSSLASTPQFAQFAVKYQEAFK